MVILGDCDGDGEVGFREVSVPVWRRTLIKSRGLPIRIPIAPEM